MYLNRTLFSFLLLLLCTLPLVSSAQLTKTLKQGDTDEEVMLLQRVLTTLGKTVVPQGEETPYFGSLTASALKSLQCEKGIVCSGDPASTGFGLLGTKTRALLNSLWKSLSSIPARSNLAQVSGAGSGLVAYYTFDEGSGTTAGDSAGSNTGTLTNGPTWTTGKIGSGAVQFGWNG